jgi:hypothetical protein
MSLERKPTGPASAEQSSPDAAAPPRTLKPSSNPAQRLQELLRREAQQSREAVQPVTEEEPSPAAPTPQPIVIPALPTPTPAPDPPAPPVAAARKKESVTLIVIVNSERSTPTEYPSMDDLPTVTSLEETHGAFLLSDEWQRRGPTLTRIVRLRRRQRRR